MPRDEWKRANERVKYGPASYAKRKKKGKRKRIPKNFRNRLDHVFLIQLRTPAIAIRPNGTETEIQTTKTLRFGKQANEHRRAGHHTFHRRGFYLIVPDQYVGRDTMNYS